MSLDVVWHVLLMQVAPNIQTWHLTYLSYVVINMCSLKQFESKVLLDGLWAKSSGTPSFVWWQIYIVWTHDFNKLSQNLWAKCIGEVVIFQQHIMHRKENKSLLSMVHSNSTNMIANWIYCYFIFQHVVVTKQLVYYSGYHGKKKYYR